MRARTDVPHDTEPRLRAVPVSSSSLAAPDAVNARRRRSCRSRLARTVLPANVTEGP
jgi:hypothetical protein